MLPQNSKSEKEKRIMRLPKFESIESRDGMPLKRLLEFWWKVEEVPGGDDQDTGEMTGKMFRGWQEPPQL